jgi:hypothetical protein
MWWCYPDTIAEARCGMATIPQVKHASRRRDEDPAVKIARLIEEHFDEMGWSEEERNERVAKAGARVDAAVARARSSKSV